MKNEKDSPDEDTPRDSHLGGGSGKHAQDRISEAPHVTQTAKQSTSLFKRARDVIARLREKDSSIYPLF